jgi:prepilin-type N-terminal cleavage/methylation domain-containing protein
MDTTKKHIKSGFTLVELLVVITIIGILAGLAVPGVSKALESAKRTRAAAMVSNLKVALNLYQTEYGRWPTEIFSGSDEIESKDSQDLYDLLIGKEMGAGTSNPNPRRIVFMEFNKKDFYPTNSSGDSVEGFQDPWEESYFIKVDDDYDNVIEVPNTTGGTGETEINASVAIWTKAIKAGDTDNPRRYIISW